LRRAELILIRMKPPVRGVPFRADRQALAVEQRKSLHRAMTAIVLKSKPSSRIGPEQYCASAWPGDDLALHIVKAASSPATTATAGALQLSTVGMFRSLAPSSAALALFDRGFSVDLRGLASVRIPSITSALPSVTFVAEGAPAAAIDLSFSSNAVGPVKKLMIMSAVSEELEVAGPELASAVVGRVLNDAVSKALDAAAFGTQVADGITPAGLLNGVTPITAAAAGASAMGADLGALAAAIADANIDTSDLVYVASPRLATVIRVNASPKFDNVVMSSLAMPDKSVAAFAPAATLSGFGDLPSVETSTQATINFAEPASELVTAGGAVARPIYSVFQQGLIAIRLRNYVAWTCVPGGAAVVDSVNW
jgi:hypothetical protein